MSRGIFKQGSGYNVKVMFCWKDKNSELKATTFPQDCAYPIVRRFGGPTKIVKALSASVSHQRCASKGRPLDPLHGSCLKCHILQEELCPSHWQSS